MIPHTYWYCGGQHSLDENVSPIYMYMYVLACVCHYIEEESNFLIEAINELIPD